MNEIPVDMFFVSERDDACDLFLKAGESLLHIAAHHSEEAARQAALAAGEKVARPPAGPWGMNDLMAVAAVRYCLGRRTYIVGICVEWLQGVWIALGAGARRCIQRDIEEALGAGCAGDEADVRCWRSACELWRAGS